MATNPVLAALTSALMRKRQSSESSVPKQKRPVRSSHRDMMLQSPFMTRVPAHLQNLVDAASDHEREAIAECWRKALQRG